MSPIKLFPDTQSPPAGGIYKSSLVHIKTDDAKSLNTVNPTTDFIINAKKTPQKDEQSSLPLENVCPSSMMGLSGTDSTIRMQSTNDAKTTSLNDYAHLTSHLKQKGDQFGAASANSTIGMEVAEDEKLSENLSLFMDNMRKVDIDRKKQILAVTITDNAPTQCYALELETDGTDFHTVFKN